MRISEFIERSNAAPDPNQVFELYRQAVAEFGYDRIGFAAVTPAAQEALGNDACKPIVALNYTEDWAKHYFDQRYHEIDPLFQLAPSKAAPMPWADLVSHAKLTARQKQIFSESREAGLYNGITIPLHGPLGESYVVSLATDQCRLDNTPHLGRLRILATQFYLAYSEAARRSAAPGVGARLTDRERECLTWTARGKSAWAISVILGVSENTVNFHLKSVMKKLGAGNRVTAVVSAIRSGLIAP